MSAKPYAARTIPELLTELHRLATARPLPFPRALAKAAAIGALVAAMCDAAHQSKLGRGSEMREALSAAARITSILDTTDFSGPLR